MSSPAFDPDGPLPWGRTAIEASAGTGKTHTLSSLVVRYIAEADVKIDQILVVTFTRAAAAELGERVRSRIAEEMEDDPTGRLRAALSDFDSATITTIHGFAQQTLATLGLGSPGDPDARLINDTSDLVASVTSDRLAALALRLDDPGDLPPIEAVKAAAKRVLGNPGVRVEPPVDSPEIDRATANLRSVVDDVVQTVARRRTASGTMSFDDILTRLADALSSPTGMAAAALAQRFRVALIDEFQDTDPVQWRIFSEVFGTSRDSALVLVGDPKQAIYSFRGANVDTYIDALASAGTDRYTLGVNWRSNASVIESLNHLFDGASFGRSIGFSPVTAAPANADRLMSINGKPASGLVIRRSGPATWGTAKKRPTILNVGPAETLVTQDLVERVLDLLETAKIPEGPDGAIRPLQPSDVAVLTRKKHQAESIKRALLGVGIPAVVLKGEDVFNSPAAAQWRRLLAGVASPENPLRARAVAIGWFFGWSYEHLDRAPDAEVAAVSAQLGDWAETLDRGGVAAFFSAVLNRSRVRVEVAAQAAGRRNITDLSHIAELLQSEAPRRITAQGLSDLLDQLADRFGSEDSEAAQRRVETDAQAVSLMTMHSAKGLEFPVVCCPSLYRGEKPSKNGTVYSSDGARVYDLRSGKRAPAEAQEAASVEQADESRRLAYVALTRARYHTIAWLAATQDSPDSPLGSFVGDYSHVDEAPSALEGLAGRSVGSIETTEMASEPTSPRRHYSPTAGDRPPRLGVRTTDRPFDRIPERWSFTQITNRQADSRGPDNGVDDEPDRPTPANPGLPSDLPWGDLPGSAAFGTLVHRIFEEINFTSPTLAADVGRWVAKLGRSAEWPGPPELITEGIVAAVLTPLGPNLGGVRLADIDRSHRLDEMDFELRLGEAGSQATGADLGRVILSHLRPDHPLAAWATELAGGAFDVTLAGHLTGSIDALLRLDDDRYLVVDYKTNRLAAPGQPSMAADYHPSRLPEAMAHHHYPLQGLLYSVAVHRFLRWRIPDYSPGRHLAGMAYLFVRGMTGPQSPEGQGVFAWKPPAGLIADLSDLLDGSTP